MSDFDKYKADGFCGCCGKPVPHDSVNRFYCSEPCREKAWLYHHPEDRESERTTQDE